ncbi:lipopolysaccharide biosynthesis protein [Protaetiibacter larvae]|uniref:Lipopolysaccharide biosynthesis protein n=1 Tax=Protaetiibacter larvae TaxID=2592654 RepID=A0A5C1YAL9_9MICO|nr:lipopolysaccharide biosynthesis protein [Protaetiibacter larvae]QEO10259.1 lipopolysaccharide biosynthesis protein [Protaetiibacter larvae]
MSDGARAIPDDLARKATRGTAVTAGGLWMKTLVQMASTVLLARLLAPSDFGLLAMVTAVVGAADLMRDFGLTGAVIQARAIGERGWASIMWLSLLLGTGFSVIVAALAPLLAWLYGEPRLIVLTLVIAPTLLINGLAMPLQARLQRELRFGALAQLDVVSMVVGVALSIGAALLGWGVWALVVLAGAGQLYRLIALWVLVRPRFGRPRIGAEVKPLLSMGGSIFGVQLLNYAAKNLDNVIIGQQLGPTQLGFYSRAYALFLLPLQQLNGPLGRVALPVLSTLQDDPERYRRYIRGSLLVIGYLTLPAYAVAAALSGPLIELLLGPGWGPAALVFSLLAIAGMCHAIANVQGWLYITLGRAHRQFLYFLITKPVLVGGFILGVVWNGIYGVAAMYAIVTVLELVPGFVIAIRGTFVRAGDVVRPVVRPLILALLGFGAAAASTWTIQLPDILELLIGGAAGLAPALLALALPAYRRDLAELVSFARRMRGGRSAVDPAVDPIEDPALELSTEPGLQVAEGGSR